MAGVFQGIEGWRWWIEELRRGVTGVDDTVGDVMGGCHTQHYRKKWVHDKVQKRFSLFFPPIPPNHTRKLLVYYPRLCL